MKRRGFAIAVSLLALLPGGLIDAQTRPAATGQVSAAGRMSPSAQARRGYPVARPGVAARGAASAPSIMPLARSGIVAAASVRGPGRRAPRNAVLGGPSSFDARKLVRR